jgi:hypothetical protein
MITVHEFPPVISKCAYVHVYARASIGRMSQMDKNEDYCTYVRTHNNWRTHTYARTRARAAGGACVERLSHPCTRTYLRVCKSDHRQLFYPPFTPSPRK